MFVECKLDDSSVSPALKYLKTRFPSCEVWQVSFVGKKNFIDELGICVVPATEFLKKLI